MNRVLARPWGRAALGLLGLILASQAVAQIPYTPTITKYHAIWHDVDYGVAFGGVNTDGRQIGGEHGEYYDEEETQPWNLSGNKVEFTLYVGANHHPIVFGETPPPQWPTGTIGWLTNIVIKIGGETVKTIASPIEFTVGGTESWQKTSWRIATTKWADGAAIAVQVQAHIKIRFLKEDQTTVDEEKDLDQTFNFKAYNKSQLLGTKKNQQGQDDADYEDVSKGIATAAINSLGTHTHAPTSATGSLSVSESAVLANTASKTVIVDATHGAPTFFFDSYGWTTDTQQDPDTIYKQINFMSEVLPLTSAKTIQQPRYNLAVFYACAALAQANSDTAYQMVGITARAIAGFLGDVGNNVVDVKIYDNNINNLPFAMKPLDVHAQVFFGHLGSGKTVNDAAFAADGLYWVIDTSAGPDGMGNPFTAQEMKVRGDNLTRMKHVYLTPTEKFYLNAAEQSIDVDILELPVSAP